MDIIVNLAEGFMGLFDAGAETFVGWVTSIIRACEEKSVNKILL